MRIFIAFLFLFAEPWNARAQQVQSTAYTCEFTDDLTSSESLRLKEYFDPDQNMDLGKVDLFRGSQILESTATKVYQIPLWDQQIYVQIWYANILRVDGQLTLTGNNRQFPGAYTRDSLQRPILCTTLN
jgi:hypothetical protein